MKNKVINILMASLMLVIGVVGLSGERVFAGSNSMTITPPKQRIILIPGEKYTNTISVFNANDSTRDLNYEVSVGSFSQTKDESSPDDYGNVNIISESSYNQIMDWITLDKKEGVVAPNHSDEIAYTIDVPKNAPAGGQYATIVITDKTTSGVSGAGNVSIDQSFQFASIIYAEVAGETKEDGEILENDMPSFLLNGPLEATSMVQNNGNVHTDAEYILQVTPLLGGDDFCNNEEKPETSLILPETERYHAQSCDLPAVGIFKAKQTVKIFGETSIVERTVIICPLWLLFLILFVIIAIVIWIATKVRGSKKRGQSRSND